MENDIRTLTVKLSKTTIKIVIRCGEKFVEHEIQVNLVLSYYWSQNLPIVENFLELIENVIKNSVRSVFPHKKLKIKYDLRANDSLENASSIFIEFLEVKADDTLFETLNTIIALEGVDERSSLSKFISFRRKIRKIIEKEL
ncbi:MAG: hypothetical protein LBB45_07835 [Methanobrevibacter sp.]|jgi:hypothetical protein|nr:hypothetical protein [Candidatus Methanovirga basalitermitum]